MPNVRDCLEMEYEKSIIKVALYISSNDGVLSNEEEVELIRLAKHSFSNINRKLIDSWIDEFFKEDLQLESYCEELTDNKNRILALNIAVETASADGLDIKENLALLKVMNYWGISWKEITRA